MQWLLPPHMGAAVQRDQCPQNPRRGKPTRRRLPQPAVLWGVGVDPHWPDPDRRVWRHGLPHRAAQVVPVARVRGAYSWHAGISLSNLTLLYVHIEDPSLFITPYLLHLPSFFFLWRIHFLLSTCLSPNSFCLLFPILHLFLGLADRAGHWLDFASRQPVSALLRAAHRVSEGQRGCRVHGWGVYSE